MLTPSGKNLKLGRESSQSHLMWLKLPPLGTGDWAASLGSSEDWGISYVAWHFASWSTIFLLFNRVGVTSTSLSRHCFGMETMISSRSNSIPIRKVKSIGLKEQLAKVHTNMKSKAMYLRTYHQQEQNHHHSLAWAKSSSPRLSESTNLRVSIEGKLTHWMSNKEESGLLPTIGIPEFRKVQWDPSSGVDERIILR